MYAIIKHSPSTILGYRKNGKPIYPIAGGSEDAGFVDNAGTEQPPVAEESPAGNPAWDPILSQIPDSLHHVLLPELQKWDQSVQQRIQTVQDEYAPYKTFKEQNIDGEGLNYAWGLLQELQNDPQAFYNAIGEHFKFQNPEPTPVTPVAEDGYEVAPEIQRLQEGYETLAKIMLSQNQAAEAQQADAQVDSMLATLHEQHGDFDEGFVLTQMLQGADEQTAVKAYQDLTANILAQANRPPAPRVLGSGSGVPSTPVDPTNMTDQERRKLVTSILQANLNT